MTKLKKSISLILALTLLFAIFPIVSLSASAISYNATAAVDYAHNHWNDGKGQCAEFVSDCLKAGGCSCWSTTCSSQNSSLWYQLVRDNHLPYIICPSNDQISVGDVIFYETGSGNYWGYNETSSGWDHVAIVCDIINGVPKVCAHNNARKCVNWTLGYSGTAVVKMGGSSTGGNTPTVDWPVLVDYNYPTHIDSGKAFSIYGRIYSCQPLEWACVWVADMDNNIVQQWNNSSRMNECNIGSTADNYIHFGQLPDGAYHYCVEATDTNHTYRMLLDQVFTVGNVATPSDRTGVYSVTTQRDTLTIYSGAGDYNAIGSVPRDTMLNVTEVSGTWGKITYDGVTGYVSMYYCTLITPFINSGADFYAYIIQAEQWKHTENANGNFQISSGGNDTLDPRQIWHFKRLSDGSYNIINCYDDSYLDNYESNCSNQNNIISWPNSSGAENQQWYLTDGGYIVLKQGNAMAVDVTNNDTSPGSNLQLYQLNLTGAQRFSVYNLTKDGVQYAKPAKPAAPTITSSSPVTVNTNATMQWSISGANSRYDQRSYTVKIWKPDGTLWMNKTGITETSLTVKYPATGAYTVQVIAVNDKYADYYTESAKSTVTVQTAHTHSYGYKVTKAPTTSAIGTLTGTCSSCGGTTTVTLPKLNTTDYTYSVTKQPSYTATGIGRYTWKTTTYGTHYFDVTLPKLTATLTKIEIASSPTKTTYKIGENLNTAGMALKATYSDGSTKTVSSGFTTSGFDSSTAGNKSVTVSYGGKTASFQVTVSAGQGGTVYMSDVTARAGETFTTLVYIKNNPGTAYTKFKVDYSSELTLVSATDKGLFTGIFTTSQTAGVKPYVLQWMGADNATGDGCFVALTFKVANNAKDGTYKISISCDEAYNAALDDVTFVAGTSTVTVSSYLPGDVNRDGKVNGKDGVLLAQYLGERDVIIDMQAADVNKDGKINGKDGVLLSQHLAGWDIVLK